MPIPDEPPCTSKHLAGRQPPALEDVAPDREERLAKPAAADHIHARRHRQRMVLMGQRVLGVAAARQQRADRGRRPSTASPARPDRRHLAGRLQPRQVRGPRRRRVAPARCSASGRFTPAARTRIRISPAIGCGTGRVAGRSTSGPPGSAISITRISAGSAIDSPQRPRPTPRAPEPTRRLAPRPPVKARCRRS